MGFQHHLNRATAGLLRTDPSAAIRLVFWALILSALATTHADADLWGHVLFGRDIWHSSSIPRTDPYSFTSDIPWVNHEWLAEVSMYLAYAAAGPTGLSLLRVLLIALTVAVVARRVGALRTTALAADLLLAGLVVALVPQTATIRPQNFSILFFTLLIVTLDGRSLGLRSDWRVAMWLAALMAAWVNTHGGWIVGAGTLVFWGGVSLFGTQLGGNRAGVIVRTVVPLIGVLLNPYGTEMLHFIRSTVGFGRADIVEWLGVWQGRSALPALFWAPVAVFTAGAIWRLRGQLDVVQLCLVLAFGLASFRVRRLIGFFAIASVVLLGARLLSRASASTGRRPSRHVEKPLAVWGPAVLIILLLLAQAARNADCVLIEGAWSPDDRAAAYIQGAQLRGKLLTWFDWGQYAIWHFSPSLRVSMDGRRETVYSDQTRERHNDAYADRPGGLDYALSLGADYAWLPRRVPLAGRLQGSGWQVIFASDKSVVLASPHTAAPAPEGTGSPPAAVSAPRCFPGP